MMESAVKRIDESRLESDLGYRFGYVAEFMQGLALCQESCAFWAMCRGAQPSNRYFETGGLAVAETAHCRNTRQAPLVAFAATFTT